MIDEDDERPIELTDRELVCPACTLVHLRAAGLAACDMPEGLLAA